MGGGENRGLLLHQLQGRTVQSGLGAARALQSRGRLCTPAWLSPPPAPATCPAELLGRAVVAVLARPSPHEVPADMGQCPGCCDSPRELGTAPCAAGRDTAQGSPAHKARGAEPPMPHPRGAVAHPAGHRHQARPLGSESSCSAEGAVRAVPLAPSTISPQAPLSLTSPGTVPDINTALPQNKAQIPLLLLSLHEQIMLGDTQASLWHRYPAVPPGVCPGPVLVSCFALRVLLHDPLSSACPLAPACTLGPGDISSSCCHDTPAKAEMHKRKGGRVGRRVKRRKKSFWSYLTISGSIRCPQSAVAKKT